MSEETAPLRPGGSSGIAPVEVYGGGPLEEESTQIAATLCAFSCVGVAVCGPIVLAYLAGAADGSGEGGALRFAAGGAALPAVAIAAALLLLALVWGCCCDWQPKLSLSVNLLGKFFRTQVGKLTPDDQESDDHVSVVTKLVRAANKQQASRPGADPTSIMEKEGIACENITAPSTTGGPEIPIRVYRPEEGQGLPLLIFLHGGGWVIGGTNGGKDNGGHDGICCRFAAKLKCAVALVDYRKAPAHKFPAAPDDCLDVLRFAVSEAGAAKLRIDRSNVAIGGDSAGGNLSCVLAHDALAAGIQLKHQLLVYPVTSARVHWCVPAPLPNRLTHPHLSSAPPRKPAACHSALAQTWLRIDTRQVQVVEREPGPADPLCTHDAVVLAGVPCAL